MKNPELLLEEADNVYSNEDNTMSRQEIKIIKKMRQKQLHQSVSTKMVLVFHRCENIQQNFTVHGLQRIWQSGKNE